MAYSYFWATLHSKSPGMVPNVLFNRYLISDVLGSQQQRLKEKIQSLEANYVLNTSEEDVVKWLVTEFALDVPELNESEIHIDYAEKQIDVSRDPTRLIFDHNGPFYVPGTQLTFVLPFAGDPALLEVGRRASHGTVADLPLMSLGVRFGSRMPGQTLTARK